VEVASPYVEADLFDLQFVQSADQMWITHRNYPSKVLTRTAHTTWTLDDFEIQDGPFGDINDTATTLTPATTGHATPKMTGLTAPSGTVSTDTAIAAAWQVFNRSIGESVKMSADSAGWLQYQFPSGQGKVVNHYWIAASANAAQYGDTPTQWTLKG